MVIFETEKRSARSSTSTVLPSTSRLTISCWRSSRFIVLNPDYQQSNTKIVKINNSQCYYVTNVRYQTSGEKGSRGPFVRNQPMQASAAQDRPYRRHLGL